MLRAIALALALVFGAGVQTQAQDRVVFAFGSSGFLFLPYYVAVGAGYFQRENIAPELVVLNGGPLAMSAVLSGDAHVLGSGIHLNMEAQLRRQNVQAFAALVNSVPSQVVVQGDIAQRAGVTAQTPLADRIRVLRGLRIGITGVGSSTDKFLRSLLQSARIDPERDVTIVPMGTASPLLAAFSQRRIDAYIFSSPTAEVGQVEFGGVSLINLARGEFEPLRDFLYNCYTARADWLERNPDVARRITRATASALQLIHDNPEEAMRVARSFFQNLPQPVYEAAFRQSVASYPRTPRIDPAGVERNFAFMEEMEGGRPNLRPEALFTNAFIDDAPASR